jgi:beta-glucosidase-like glycosyl hydrolase
VALGLGFLLAVGCHPPLPTHPTPADPAEVVAAPALEATSWVDATLARLTLPQKSAQILFVRAGGPYRPPESPEVRELRSLVAELGVGGVVLFATELEAVPRQLGDLQRIAPVPLLVASDLERGLSFRVDPGPVPLPSAMAFGATGSEAAAYFLGEVTAREARAVGIHWALAPVVDVNNNPDNPVINIRSFGEDPALVGRLGAAFVRGARAGGVLTSAKHFPGHGDTATDSHLARPRLDGSRERLDAVELAPFRELIAAGVDSIMVGHLEAPALDPTNKLAKIGRAHV